MFLLIVSAGRGGVKEANGAVPPSGFEHITGNHGVIINENRFVRCNETHSAHVSGQVENDVAALGHIYAILKNKMEGQEISTQLEIMLLSNPEDLPNEIRLKNTTLSEFPSKQVQKSEMYFFYYS